ncbi:MULTISPECIES: hypothetical protein [Bacillales]|nr:MULTISPECIES: hypothetical protein [Bacillales]
MQVFKTGIILEKSNKGHIGQKGEITNEAIEMANGRNHSIGGIYKRMRGC